MKFVIFDIDGTLANTKQVEDKCFIAAFKQSFGLDISNQKWEDLKHVTDWGITEEIIKRELKREPKPSENALMISNFVKELKHERQKDISQFKEVNGAKNFFEHLHGQEHYRMGIATGSWEKSARLKLETIGIKLDAVAFSNSDFYRSREKIMEHVIHQLRLNCHQEPEEIIYFGDGIWDLQACQNLGIKFIGIDVIGDGKLKSLGAKVVFRNYLEIEKLLEEIRKTDLTN